MTESEKSLRRIEALLTAIAAKIGAELPKRGPGGASVAAFNRATGEITDDGGDVPSAMTPEMRRVMKANEHSRRLNPGRRSDVRPFRGEDE